MNKIFQKTTDCSTVRHTMPGRSKRRNGRTRKQRARVRRGAYSDYLPSTQALRRANLAPPYLHLHLTYSDLTAVSGITYGNRLFGLNCLYDTNISGVGSQPVGFDQWMAIYQHYQVLKCRWVVEYYNTSSATLAECVTYPSLNGSPLTNAPAAISQPYARHGLTSGTGAKPYTKLTNNTDIAFISGRPTSPTAYQGTPTTNPTTIIYGNVVVNSIDGVSNLTGYYRLTLKYFVRFFEVNQLDLS